MPQKLTFTYICIYLQDILPPHLFLFYSLCINVFCFQPCFPTQMILTLNVYPKSKPKEGRWVGRLGLCREVFFLLYNFIYCKVHVHLVFSYCPFLNLFIYFSPITKHEIINISYYMYVNEFCLKHPRMASAPATMSCLNRCLPNPKLLINFI